MNILACAISSAVCQLRQIYARASCCFYFLRTCCASFLHLIYKPLPLCIPMIPKGKDLEQLTSTYFRLIHHNELDKLRQFLLEGNVDINVNNLIMKPSRDTGLHICARLGPQYFPILKFLVEEREGNIHQINVEGKTPLHDAAQFCNYEVVNYLVEKGANVNAVKRADWTPLMLACTKADNEAVIKRLLEAGSLPFFVNKDGWNCCHLTAREGNPEIVKIILNAVDTEEGKLKLVEGRSRNGRIPLHTAVMHGHLEMTRLLIQEGGIARVHAEDHCGTIPLMDACRCGFIHLIHFLIQTEGGRLEDLYRTNKQGQNCIHIAAEAGQAEVVRELVLKFGMDVNVASSDMAKMTALHWASKEGHGHVAATLLDLGADVNIPDGCGRLAPHIVETFGHAKDMKLALTSSLNV